MLYLPIDEYQHKKSWKWNESNANLQIQLPRQRVGRGDSKMFFKELKGCEAKIPKAACGKKAKIIHLTHFSPVLHCYTPWKHQKTFRLSDVFRGYSNLTLGWGQYNYLTGIHQLSLHKKMKFSIEDFFSKLLDLYIIKLLIKNTHCVVVKKTNRNALCYKNWNYC